MLLWAAVVVAGVAAFAAHRLRGAERSGQGEFGKVPSFALVDQRGQRVTDRDLQGTPWVANFVFTRCPSVCPLLSAKFKAFQDKLGAGHDVTFVSFSVDPTHDTPEVLAEYAARYDADPKRWRFLTGSLSEIERTVVKGFKIHIGEPEPRANDPSLIDIMHGEHLVLIDRAGVIRGYYRAEPAEFEELQTDLRKLISEGSAHAQLVQ